MHSPWLSQGLHCNDQIRCAGVEETSTFKMSEKRMVSSVFITLAPPWRGTPDPKEGTLRAPETRRDEPHQGPRSGQAAKGSAPARRELDENYSPHGHGMRGTAEPWADFPNGEIVFPHPVLDDFSLGTDLLSLDLPPPPPPIPRPPPQLTLAELPPPTSGEPLSPGLQKLDPALSPNIQVSSAFSVESKPQKTHPTNFKQMDPSPAPKRNLNGQVEEESSAGTTQDQQSRGKGVCAFCHKAISPHASALEAMRKQYHAGCFTCRTCHRELAGQLYYQKDGQPICDPCYKATLEKCARCQAVILEKIVRAMGSGYHPSCFTCVVCHRRIAEESFAVDDQNEVHCVADYYRKYASVCSVCRDPIIPMDGEDSYKIECLGRSFHEKCYRCEKCKIPLSVEPTEKGCYPLNSHILCKSCHVAWNVESSC
ncbi:filamin-binding LIM protein 1 isoform X2 [Rhinatrema bivittatum]|uniref:filamin-binding LIM protein 1 isoform X2 n=1 Tax=Rhinatrema bivittatum TaxID=194408 RepID=UPI00112B19B4|nr:filamin-binding LIM protein 1 isoform X2 [Rhinatrema bivittatum]